MHNRLFLRGCIYNSCLLFSGYVFNCFCCCCVYRDELGRFVSNKHGLTSLKMEGCSNLRGFSFTSTSLSTLWLSDLHSLSKMVIEFHFFPSSTIWEDESYIWTVKCYVLYLGRWILYLNFFPQATQTLSCLIWVGIFKNHN